VRQNRLLDNLTRPNKPMAMDAVRIAELRARLSEYLRRVRQGQALAVMDRETPIAQIIPYQAGPAPLSVRHPMPGESSPQSGCPLGWPSGQMLFNSWLKSAAPDDCLPRGIR
jgi:prevent-host-death family protein